MNFKHFFIVFVGLPWALFLKNINLKGEIEL